MRSGTIVLLGLLGLACTRAEPGAEASRPAASGARDPDLAASLGAQVEADTVRLDLHLTNVSGDTVVLEFATAQRYDFEVRRASGDEVWRWSSEQMFAQVVGTERLAPGETVRYRGAWGGGGSGGYTAVGRLTSTNKPIELRTEFEIRGR